MYLILDDEQAVVGWSEMRTGEEDLHVNLSQQDVDKLQSYPLGVLCYIGGNLVVKHDKLLAHETDKMLAKLSVAYRQQKEFPIPLTTPDGVFYIPNNQETFDYIDSSVMILQKNICSTVPLVVYQEDAPYRIDIGLALATNIQIAIHTHRHNLVKKYKVDKYTEVLSATTLEELFEIRI